MKIKSNDVLFLILWILFLLIAMVLSVAVSLSAADYISRLVLIGIKAMHP